MKRIFAFFLSLLLILGICPMSALADTGGSGNVDGGGGSMGQGTSQNSWNPGMDGVRITVVDAESGQPVSTPFDLTNKNPTIKIHFGKVSKIQYTNGSGISPNTTPYTCKKPDVAMPRIISTGSTKASIEAIKKYFCSEYAVELVAQQTGINYDELIGGEYKLLLEPIAYFKHNGIMYAMTAHEAALYGMAFYLQSSLMGKNSAEFMRIYQDAQETMNHEAVEYIRGIAVVKVFGQTVKSFAKFHNAIETYKKYALAYTMSCKKGMVAFNAIVNSSFLVLVPIGFLVGFTTPTLRDFIQSFLFYVIFSPACAVMLNKIMYMTSYKMQAEESMRRIDMILTSEQQPEPAIPQYPDTYEVAFEDVTFAYDNTDHPAVSHLTFMAKAGAITALVGHSGSGKSTAASLIPRFYDVQDGAVKIGGVDIREIPQGDLMKMVAFVFQDPKLFKDSLLENIRAGRPSATREEVLKAAHLAQCDDILKKLPNGIDTIIGSQGIYLSGGETQRISIARAILKDAPIVVLDEATAYADPENEHQIQKAFDGLIKNKTVIMIAHRLSTVQDADQILVMKNGAIVESGTHSDLIKLQGEYAKMWDNYNKTVQWHIES